MPAGIADLTEFAVLLQDGLDYVFNASLKAHPILWQSWLRQETAKEWTSTGVVHTGLGAMPRKDVGGPFVTDKPFISGTTTYTLVPYGLAFVITKEMLEWDQYGVFGQVTKWLAKSGADRKNIIGAFMLNEGFATTNQTIYNGEALFSATHALLRTGAGTASNKPAVASGLSYLAMQSALTNFSTQVDEDGLYTILMPTLLVCHPTNGWVADTLLNSNYRPDNANNAKNTLSGKLTADSRSPYLSSTTAWFVFADKSEVQACVDMGKDLQFQRDVVPSSWNVQFSMYMAARLVVQHWRGTYGDQGA